MYAKLLIGTAYANANVLVTNANVLVANVVLPVANVIVTIAKVIVAITTYVNVPIVAIVSTIVDVSTLIIAYGFSKSRFNVRITVANVDVITKLGLRAINF